MTSTSDYMLDRRRLRRKLGFWRLAAIAVALVAALIATAKFSGIETIEKATPHIARLSLEGMILGDKDTVELIKEIGKSRASAVLVEIDSPGGTTTGSERLYLELRKLSEKKPLVAVVGTVGASGAYIAALGADEIVVRGNSLVGSIGVLFQYPNFYKALDSMGLKIEEIKSSPLKAAPNGFQPTSEEAKAAVAALVSDSYEWFKGLVKERRRLSDAELAKVSDGRVFTGRQSISLKLADLVGGEPEAVEWLETQKGVAKKLPIRDWKKKPSLERAGLLGLASVFARASGFGALAALLEEAQARGGSSSLDGLLAIWQGPATY
jgi:protease-4